MDLEYSSNILDTPSLTTPNIRLNPLIYKISHTPTIVDVNNEDNHNLTTNPPSIITTTITNNESLSTSSNDIKLSKIEDDLKRTFTQPRKPTESLFQKMAKAGVLSIENVSIPSNIDDGIPVDVPSTAEVMNDLESFSKYTTQENIERETTSILTSDNNNHFDTSSSSSSLHTMGVVVAPKKKLLQRTQSRTEPTSPTSITNNQFSQSQKTDFNDTSSIDDDHQLSSNNDFQRLHDIPLLIHTIDSHPQLDNSLKPPYTIQLKTDQNGVHPTIIKQQPMTPTNKRTFQQTIVGGSIPKANSILISQQPVINEATSSNQLLNIKRQKTIPIQNNTLNINSSFPSSSSSSLATTPTTPENNNVGSDDHRKKQIRDSNREAARRCRERRRQYIEQLEGNLEQCKQQIKQLNEKLSHAERENTQLRAIITETKRFHSTSCLPSNESMLDFVNVITTNGIELNSDSTDGNMIPRSYFPRNTH